MGAKQSKKSAQVEEMVKSYMSMRVKTSWDADRAESQIVHNMLSLLLMDERRVEFLGKEIVIKVEIAPGREEVERHRMAKEEDDQKYWEEIDRFPAST
jgi:hypothetical protein